MGKEFSKVSDSVCVVVPQNEMVAREMVGRFEVHQAERGECRIPFKLPEIEFEDPKLGHDVLDEIERYFGFGSGSGMVGGYSLDWDERLTFAEFFGHPAISGKPINNMSLEIILRKYVDTNWAHLEYDLWGKGYVRRKEWIENNKVFKGRSHYIEDDGRDYLALHPRNHDSLVKSDASQVEFDEWMDYHAFIFKYVKYKEVYDWEQTIEQW